MSKNIYLYNKINAQDNFEVNQLTVNQKLHLTGSTANELLITDANSDVVNFTNGPDRYLLEIDSATHAPAWTNNISIDDITTNTMTINNTQQGDVLVIGDTQGSVDRLPLGLNNTVLAVDTSGGYPLKYKSIDSILNLSQGKLFVDNTGIIYTDQSSYGISGAVVFSSSTVLYSINKTVVNGRNYKASVSFNNIQSSGNNTYTLNISDQTPLTYVTTSTSSQENIIFPFTASFNGSATIQLVGSHLPSGAGTVNKVSIICEAI